MAEDLLLATDAGVVTVRRDTDDGTGTWAIASSGLAEWSVTDVAESPTGRRYASTRGDGVWVSVTKPALLRAEMRIPTAMPTDSLT